MNDTLHDGWKTIASEGMSAGEQLIHDYSEGEDIGLVGDHLLAHLFWRHIQWRADITQELGVGHIEPGSDGNAKIADLDVPRFGQQNIPGLDVAVYDPISVRIVEGDSAAMDSSDRRLNG